MKVSNTEYVLDFEDENDADEEFEQLPFEKRGFGFRASQYRKCLGCTSTLMSMGYTTDAARAACFCTKILI